MSPDGRVYPPNVIRFGVDKWEVWVLKEEKADGAQLEETYWGLSPDSFLLTQLNQKQIHLHDMNG